MRKRLKLRDHGKMTSSTTPPSVSRATTIPLREVWPREQQDFSRWLVENIDFLNEHLPFSVDPESLATERSAGDFYVDVVGDAVRPGGEAFKVVIENQLEETDHKHLGQVLTYVAAFDASAAIWISAKARPEHAKAVQWLNDESNIEAWLFNIEVITIDGSARAPILRQIIGPSALSGKAKQEKRATEAYKSQKLAFWTAVLPVVKADTAPIGILVGRDPSTNPYQSQKADGPATAYWQIWVTSKATWICLRIHGDSKKESAHYFDQLSKQREAIEEKFGETLIWDSLPDATGSVIRWDNPEPGGYKDTDDTWNQAAPRLAQGLRDFVASLSDPIRNLTTYVHNSEDFE